MTETEGSLINRFVVIITPFFTLAAGWLAGVVAHAVPGVHLDRGQIVAFMVAVATATLTTVWKWLEGWQRHEQHVADGTAHALASPDAPLLARIVGAHAGDAAPGPAAAPAASPPMSAQPAG